MAFWSGHTLRARLAELIDQPDVNNVDCAAYTLAVGPEFYVTPSDGAVNPSSTTLQSLARGQSFAVPPGQFAYVLTEEVVTIPTCAIGFISIRARVKWRGLVNVSGFHVDPGFTGRLLFAVFNAGPVAIHLRRGDPTFLIWFADLDQDVPADSKQGMRPVTHIDTGAINQVSGVIYSIQGLADKIRTTEKELAQRITVLERENSIVKVIAAALLTLLLGLAVQWIVRQVGNAPPQPPAATVPLPQSHSPTPSPASPMPPSGPPLPPRH
jgi:dCTP deaminase